MSVSFNPEEVYTRLQMCIEHFGQNENVSKINEEISAIAAEIPKKHSLSILFQFANQVKMVKEVALRQLKSLQNMVKPYVKRHTLEQIEAMKSEQEGLQQECAKMIERALESKRAIKKLEATLSTILKLSEAESAAVQEQAALLTTFESKLSLQNKEIAELERCLLGIGEEIDKKKGEVDKKLSLLTGKIETGLFTVRRVSKEVFHEFEVDSAILKEGAVFNSSRKSEAWGGTWWLQVKRSGDNIGLHLCSSPDFRSPVAVDYQLMVKKHSSDDIACASSLYRNEFGKELKSGEKTWAWGLGKFTTLDQIESAGGCSLTEKRVIFGVSIFPIDGLEWGEYIKESADSFATYALSIREGQEGIPAFLAPRPILSAAVRLPAAAAAAPAAPLAPA